MNKSKKSSQTGSLHLLRISENSSSANLQKEASDTAQSAVQVPLVNHINLPTKVRSRCKVKVEKLQIHSELLNNISNDQSDLPIISLHSRTINLKVRCSPTISVWKLNSSNLDFHYLILLYRKIYPFVCQILV